VERFQEDITSQKELLQVKRILLQEKISNNIKQQLQAKS
jgi:hypothetical protein